MAGPFFLPDLSSWEGDAPNFGAIAAAPNMVGCIIKSSQGLGPGTAPGHPLTWFKDNWPRVRAVGAGFLGWRYGTAWFRGCYHYGSPAASGAAQADYMLSAVEKAGGWGDGDLAPAWDLEGDAWTSGQQIVDVSSQFAERVKQRLGRSPILYTGSVWRKFGITDPAGFAAMWTTHMDLMAPFGWPNPSVILHQYVGDEKYWNPSGQPAKLAYPTSVPGLDAKVDMSVVMDGGVPATSIERVRAILLGTAGPLAAGPRGRGDVGGGGGKSSMPIVLGVGAGLAALGLLLASTAGRGGESV